MLAALLCLGLWQGSPLRAQSMTRVEGGLYAGWHEWGCGGLLTCDDSPRLGVGAVVSGAAPVARLLDFGVEASVWRRGEDTGTHQTQLHVVLTATLRPPTRDGVFLRAGAGYGWLRKSFAVDPSESYHGLAWSASSGYRLPVGNSSWLVPFVGLSSVPYYDDFRTTLYRAGVGFGHFVG